MRLDSIGVRERLDESFPINFVIAGIMTKSNHNYFVEPLRSPIRFEMYAVVVINLGIDATHTALKNFSTICGPLSINQLSEMSYGTDPVFRENSCFKRRFLLVLGSPRLF